MATKIDTATVTGADVRIDAPIKRSGGSHVNLNGFRAPQPLAPIRTHMKKKYRHVAAVHSKPRTSCLSHDSQVSPSFLGFRNLMVIVLGIVATSGASGVESNSSHLVVGNLRLMIENFKKVRNYRYSNYQS
jgi:diacylglycerol O-acyltransferase-1